MTTVSFDGAHVPLLIVHSNLFTPTPSPVTPDVGEEGVVTAPPPESTAQLPVPEVGVFPASVAEVEQTA
jgi:hypothetical protein